MSITFENMRKKVHRYNQLSSNAFIKFDEITGKRYDAVWDNGFFGKPLVISHIYTAEQSTEHANIIVSVAHQCAVNGDYQVSSQWLGTVALIYALVVFEDKRDYDSFDEEYGIFNQGKKEG